MALEQVACAHFTGEPGYGQGFSPCPQDSWSTREASSLSLSLTTHSAVSSGETSPRQRLSESWLLWAPWIVHPWADLRGQGEWRALAPAGQALP